MTDFIPYNPLEKGNIGASVAVAMLGRKTRPLASLPAFDGAGIYAIYYQGTFKPYHKLSILNQGDDPQVPIYVGKAIPEGGRVGATIDPLPTKALSRRLREHAESIKAVSNLKIEDFVCRFLVVDDIWIPLGESLLIAKFSPLWNMSVAGFGNHDPGNGRYQGAMPRWDVVHPGRGWAARCQPRKETVDHIVSEIEARLSNEPSLIRARFLAEQPRGSYKVSPRAES